MHGFRGIAVTGFIALMSVALAMIAMLGGVIGARLGIWLVTMSLGLYGLALGLGVWADRSAERERLSAPSPSRTWR